MRQLILKMSITADGFVCGPNGEADWVFKNMSPESKAWTEKLLWQAGAHLMGSRTFYDMVNYWPTSTDSLAPAMNEIPKIVFSRKGNVDLSGRQPNTQALNDANRFDKHAGVKPLNDPIASSNWSSTTVLTGPLDKEIEKLKQQDGKPLLAHGGAGFAQSLIQTGLIDEYQLLVFPVALGKGLPIFSKLEKPLDLKLADHITFKTGMVAHIYRPA